MYNAIGMLEFISIAKGIEACDAMLKTAPVELIDARTACAGKYYVLVAGGVDAVSVSVEKGREIGQDNVVDSFIIPNIHHSVFPALTSSTKIEKINALGVLETYSIASSIYAADIAVKTARIELIEIRLASGMGGKSFITLTGEVAAVEASVDAGAQYLIKEGMLVNKVVIPAPHKDLEKAIF